MSYKNFLSVQHFTNWARHNLLPDNILNKVTQGVLVRCSVIMSNHDVKLAIHFQNLVKQCLLTDCYFQNWFRSWGWMQNCGNIFKLLTIMLKRKQWTLHHWENGRVEWHPNMALLEHCKIPMSWFGTVVIIFAFLQRGLVWFQTLCYLVWFLSSLGNKQSSAKWLSWLNKVMMMMLDLFPSCLILQSIRFFF